jgi:CheY-like chemotaxis protein
VAVDGVLRQVVEVTRPRWKDEAQAKGAPVDVRLDIEPIPLVLGNAAELREVFINLVMNGLDAMPGGGNITLGARLLRPEAGRGGEGGEAVEVFVRDTGVGMPEEVRRRAFEPFFTTKGQRGSGLGLSVGYGIVARMGGTIAIDSREGAGTTIRVRLPVSSAERTDAGEKTQAAAPPSRILVVDDEAILADTLAEMLRLQGHTVEAVTDPRDVLPHLEANSVDLLFTDLAMPELSGWEVVAQVHRLRPHVPVILVTGYGNQVDPEQVRRAGVSQVVSKPFRWQDIHQAVIAALGSSPSLN